MMLAGIVLAAYLIGQGATVLAQDASATPAPLSSESVQLLLDEIPNYPEILGDQWSAELPTDVYDAETSIEAYGRLLDTQPVQSLTLAECVALALQHNTNLQVQRLTPVSAAAGVRQARAVFDPALFGEVNKGRNVAASPVIDNLFNPSGIVLDENFNGNIGVRKTLLTGGVLAVEWDNNRFKTIPSLSQQLIPLYTSILTLSLNQPVLRGFGWRYSLLVVDVAETTAESAYNQYLAQIANLIASVERAYWTFVLAIETVGVEEQGLALAQELQRQNEGRFNVGALPQSAVLEARAEVARREALLIRARNLRDNARDNLRALINARDPGAPALLMIEPQDEPQVPPYQIDIDRSLQTALEQRPELVAARLDVRGRGLERKIAENALLPQLNFVGSVGLNGIGGEIAPTPQAPPSPTPGFSFAFQPNQSIVGDFGEALNQLYDGRYYSYFAGATIEIPLDRAQAKADYSQANISFDRARLSLRQIEETVTLEIKQAVSNLQTDLKSIEATRIARQLAQENLRDQQARYDVGLATTRDIVDYQERLTRAQFFEIESLIKYNTDLAEMRRVEGTLLEARNVVVERVSAGDTPWWAKF